MSALVPVDDLLRELAPQVLAALVRRYGQFDLAEDATQEALLQATLRWPVDGRPDNPRGWLVTVASRKLIDQMRSESSRRDREDRAHAEHLGRIAGHPADDGVPDRDDSLELLFLCCHPALSAPSQVALTLRALGGLTTAQIAHAFLVPEATMAQRISRAKQTVKASDRPFGGAEGLAVVLHVLYLIFNEGYTATTGPDLTAPHLSDEAIRLARWLHRLVPDDGEVAGLLALMLLTDARRPSRTAADGGLVPLAEQDRSRWDAEMIAEGVTLVTAALANGPAGPYQVQAAIAAVHDEAPTMEATDWPQILGLYDVLERLTPGPMVSLNRTVAVAEVHGPQAALGLLAELAEDPRMAGHHRLLATRAHVQEMAGNREAARADYTEAARRTLSTPERAHLLRKAT